MIHARITIFDDKATPKCNYVIKPSKIYEDAISKKYIFAFEYSELNCNIKKLLKEITDDCRS